MWHVSQNAIGEVLKSIIKFGSERVHAGLYHMVNQKLKSLFREVHVETIFHSLGCTYTFAEAGQWRSYNTEQQNIFLACLLLFIKKILNNSLVFIWSAYLFIINYKFKLITWYTCNTILFHSFFSLFSSAVGLKSVLVYDIYSMVFAKLNTENVRKYIYFF